jgi:hypothetical protein
MCPHTTIYVETYTITLSIHVTGIRKGGLYMCPHTTVYVDIYTMKSTAYYICGNVYYKVTVLYIYGTGNSE